MTQLNNNSKVISYKTNKIIQSLNEGLGGIRDVIINNDQKYFLGEYAKLDYSVRKADGENYFLVLIPRYAMETIGIIIIAVAAYLSLKQGSESTNVIPVLGAFALAAQRILPVMQQFYAAIGRIANAKYSLIDVVNTLNIKSENIDFTTNNNFIFEKNITLGKISYSYPESKKLVIDDLSVTIKKGDIVGIIGKTGSGKSSLVDMIMGLLDPIKGSIRVDGVDLSKHKKDWYQLISHVPQFIHLSDSSILENIAFGSSFNSLNYDKIVRVSKVAQIYDDIVQLPNGFETKVGENGMKFSGGQIQRIGIARALYKSSSILIFDEATSALDVKTEAKIIKEIERFDKKMTVIMIAHRISTLKSCNFIINLDDKNNQ
jgi:ATP-binding cassette, subfamily B, bacterial PglK